MQTNETKRCRECGGVKGATKPASPVLYGFGHPVPCECAFAVSGLLAAAERALSIHEDAGCSCEGCALLRAAIKAEVSR